MKEDILLLLQIITVDFFIAFGIYSFLFLFVSIFIKKPILYITDEYAKKFIAFIGIVYFLVWIVGIFVFYFESNAEEQKDLINRMFGKYWLGFWLQPILWFTVTQFIKINRIAKNVLLRILFSFILIISIERFVIIITSFHRDYLPSSCIMYRELEFYPSNFIFALILKIIVFLIFVGIYYLVISKLKDSLKKFKS